MQLKTYRNRVQKFKSFVYKSMRWVGTDAAPELEVEVAERANGQPICSACGRRSPGYDRLPKRRFEFVPLWGIKVFLVYAPRRVACSSCGIRVEQMALGKRPLTKAYGWFLASWARRLSWKETASVFRTSWESVFRSVEMAVEWGRAHQDLGGVQAIGIDESAWKKGHRYLTLVYQIDTHCRPCCGLAKNGRRERCWVFSAGLVPSAVRGCGTFFSDMWKPYLKVVAKKAGQAVHVLDRFRIHGALQQGIG